jgi:DNA-binding NarL/FixJ family response regulator
MAAEDESAEVDTLSMRDVLLVSNPSTQRDALLQSLQGASRRVRVVDGVRGATATLNANQDIGLVICDVRLVDGSAFQLLKFLAMCEGRKPKVIVASGVHQPSEMKRAEELGAMAYLVAPISNEDISRVLEPAHSGGLGRRPPRRRVHGVAYVLDPKERKEAKNPSSLLTWEIRDLSAAGAFLEANCPIAVGRKLWLELEFFGYATARVVAEVVRMQEPCWEHVGGVGVLFREFEDEAETLIRHYVEEFDGIYC